MRLFLSFFPYKTIANMVYGFPKLGAIVIAFFPFLKEQLQQCDADVEPWRYGSMVVISSFLNFIFVFALLSIIAFVTDSPSFVPYAFILSVAIFAISFFSDIFYPSMLISKLSRDINSTLLDATRQLIIELRSGVPLFHAMASVSTGYGAASKRFRRIVERIDAGEPQIEVISSEARKSPSFQLRRVLWQISNALTAGASVDRALSGIISDLLRYKLMDIKRYGQELNPWIMAYMVIGIIAPSLGAAALTVILSFLQFSLPPITLAFILLLLIIFNLFFIHFVSTRRPVI